MGIACCVAHLYYITLLSIKNSLQNGHYLQLSTHYNYIITGAGCAGLSLLYRMMQHPFFEGKKILVTDQFQKNKNDRTWCFWENKPGIFEEIVHHHWKQIDFFSDNFSARFDLLPYDYKMIRGIDFFNFVIEKSRQKDYIDFIYGTVKSIAVENGKTSVAFDDKIFTADFVFNSILFNDALKEAPGKYTLLQHFKGWLIKTPAAVFNERIATFMDFRVSQQHGTTFVYVLPTAPDRALVEYTLFTKELLPQKNYDDALNQYIKDFLKIDGYTISAEEYGVIPMTNIKFNQGDGNIVNIGTAGGKTKASSGFTFQFIQKHTDAVINALINNKDPHITPSIFERRFNLYDSTLLNILNSNKMGGDKIFTALFRKNPPQRVLRFLDNETNFMEELKIMRSVPPQIFLPAAIKELLG